MLDEISVIIPVREGSSRVRDKIHLPFGEKETLLEWKVKQVIAVHRPDRIFLSSNSLRVAKVAKDFGVKFLPRQDYLCDGHKASFSEVITGVVSDIPTKYFAWVTVVVPLMRPNEYLQAFQDFLEYVVRQQKYDSLVTVNSLKEYLWSCNGPLNYRADRNHTISQDLPDIFRVTNGLYMRSKKETLKEGYFLGSNPYLYKVSKLSGIDIDEQEDYDMALAMKSLYNRYES